MNKPLIDKICILKKYPGKGGWTYAEIPEIKSDVSNPFGWVHVKGQIDDFSFDHHKLMSMGNGKLFFSVNAKIRKTINKQAGDKVRIRLSIDDAPIVIPADILACLLNEEKQILENFNSLSDQTKRSYISWINEAKKLETKTDRIIKMIEKLQDPA